MFAGHQVFKGEMTKQMKNQMNMSKGMNISKNDQISFFNLLSFLKEFLRITGFSMFSFAPHRLNNQSHI